MDFVCDPIYTPLRVLMVNPLCCASQLSITKILSGVVFGTNQLIDLILLVYANEREAAEDLKLELYSCGFGCMNTITVSTNLPLISDADVFCFITNFRNPNSVNFSDIDNQEFDVLYSIIKIAKSLSLPKQAGVKDEKETKKIITEEKKPIKPIIMSDGVVTMNIIRYLAKDLPGDVFFCPTPISTIGRKILGEEMKVPAANINVMLVWGADDSVFHIEVKKPIVMGEKMVAVDHCDFEVTGEKAMDAAGFDYTEFNEKWLKKDYIDKVNALAAKNPYGSIFRAADFCRTLANIWQTRAPDAVEGLKLYFNIGVISDGSLETMKGKYLTIGSLERHSHNDFSGRWWSMSELKWNWLSNAAIGKLLGAWQHNLIQGFAYVLPIILHEDTWSVNTSYQDSFHVQQEIKRINNAVKQLKENLLPYCKRFLEENVINQAFVPPSETSNSVLSINCNMQSDFQGSAN